MRYLYKASILLLAALPQINTDGLPTTQANSNTITNVLSVIFGILGAIALLVIVIAGLRYITSAGEPQKTENAKNTIIYALIGLVVAISAEAIINFAVKGIS
jgi:uncharacterized membrane protein YidH (DUF202 family)